MWWLRNESIQTKFLITNNEIKTFAFHFYRSIRRNTGSNRIEENCSRCIKSHTGKCFVLTPNHKYVVDWLCKSFPIKSKIICVIIMDQWDFIRLDFGRKFGFGCSGLSPFSFLFSLVRRETRADTKTWFVTKAGDRFTHPLGFNQVTIALLLYFLFPQFCTLFRHRLVQRNPIFLFFFSFSFLQSLIDWFFFFLFFFLSFFSFSFLLTNISNPRWEKLCLEDPLVLSS